MWLLDFNMTAISPPLLSAIDYYRVNFIHWYEAEQGYYTRNWSDATLKVIASFNGHQKLQKQYEKEMEDVRDGMEISDEAALAESSLSDSQSLYSVPNVATCPDIWDPFDLGKLLKLTELGVNSIKKVNNTRYLYHLKVARLPASCPVKHSLGCYLRLRRTFSVLWCNHLIRGTKNV